MSMNTPAGFVHDAEIAGALGLKKETARKNLRCGVYGEPRRYGNRSGLPRNVWEDFLRTGREKKARERRRGADGKFVSTNGTGK